MDSGEPLSLPALLQDCTADSRILVCFHLTLSLQDRLLDITREEGSSVRFTVWGLVRPGSSSTTPRLGCTALHHRCVTSAQASAVAVLRHTTSPAARPPHTSPHHSWTSNGVLQSGTVANTRPQEI